MFDRFRSTWSVGKECNEPWRGRIAVWWAAVRSDWTDWERYERSVMLAIGDIEPLSRQDNRDARRMAKKLRRRAMQICDDMTFLGICEREGTSHHRLQKFITMSDHHDAPIMTRTIAKERFIYASYQTAARIKSATMQEATQ